MKKKIVSMLLALSLVISGLPVTIANAAQLDENELWQLETTNVEETTEAVEMSSGVERESVSMEFDGNADGETGIFESGVFTDAEAADKMTQGADYSRFHVNSNGKAVGSDGVTYDDVVYLSASTVAALDAQVQDDYIMLCDVAAKWAEDGIEDIVIAVDENGSLKWSCYVPGTMLAEIQKDFIEGTLASETETTEDAEDEDSSIEMLLESEEAANTEDAETATAADEIVSGEESETQSVQEATESEKSEAAEAITDNAEAESSTTGELTVDETAAEDISNESDSTEENLTEEISTEDAAVEFGAENMELIPTFVNEQVEIADEIDVDVMDLGYGMNNNFNSTLPSDSYFSKQLTSNEQKVYSVARKRLTAGNNTFEIPENLFNADVSGLKALMDAAMCSVSAVILTDTEKVEWLANPGRIGIVGDILYYPDTKKVSKCTIQVDKSAYYSKSLDDSANVQVSKLVSAAQEYAVKNYPTLPAYGVVEYFDKWICENNYYNTPGGVNGDLGPEVYYYCHSSYGALLRGYAVCESYAKAMSRLMDAVGIPNMYVTGYAFGDPKYGHAWNYVQMPDGNWYLLDSTWNNPSESAGDASLTSTKDFLLSAGDTNHTPTGSEYEGQSKGFTFPDLSTAKYVPKTGSIELNKTTMDLAVKQKFTLSCDNAEINNTYSTWSSSDDGVAKVDAKGNVTAVAPGTAVITLSTLATAGVELKAECEVNVYQVKDINSVRTGKATDNVSLGTNNPATIYLNVNVGAKSPYTAAEMVSKKLPVSNAKNAAAFEDVKCTSSKSDIADATAKLTGNRIEVKITPKKVGSSAITVNFGGKKTTIKVTVGELIDAGMFDIDWSKAGVDEKTMSINYTGKAIAPKVTKKSDADKDVKFKATYLNNKNAGTASVIISGTGKYGGEVKYDFTIKALPINNNSIDFKLSKASNVYNAGSNPAKVTVKYINGSKKTGLKLNTDYQIVYKKGNTETTNPVDAGEYTLVVKGIGSYEGECQVSDKYTISQCEINKAKVTFALSNTVMVPKVNATVKLGKNTLPKSEYDIKYYSDAEYTNEVSPIALKENTKYFAEITAKSNGNMKAGTKKFTKTFKTK